MIIRNINEALDLVGKKVVINHAKHFSDKRQKGVIRNDKYLKNVYSNFVSKKCDVLNYVGGEEGKYKFEVFNGKKVCNFTNEDFELIVEEQP